ncbi:MAG: chemotaxis protein CheW [Candidatus Acidiferrales bacterium]
MKIASQEAGKSRRARHSETIILFSVAHQTFAISAESVQEIRSTDSLAGAANEIDQPEIPKVRHTIERAHRTYYIVNACAHFSLPVTRPTLVLIMRQLRVAVLVDKIERMAEISAVHALPRAFMGEERRWYRGFAYVEDHVIPVIHPAGFLTNEEFRLLDRTAKAAESQREMEGAVQA